MSASSTKVMHGRRQGQMKTPVPERPHSGTQQGGATRVNLNDVTILSRKDWTRIQDCLSKTSHEAERIKAEQEDREIRHEMSQGLVKNWSNTIAGQRQKRLEGRKIREEKDEEERIQIDIEEEIYKAEKRKSAIEKAKRQQYYQTDRVKGFHGALLLTEVLREREAQLDLKSQIEAANAGKDSVYQKQIQEELERSTLVEQKKAANRRQNNEDNASYHKKQIRHHMREREQEQDIDREEGKDIQHSLRQYEAEKRRITDIEQKEKREMMQALQETVANREIMKAIEQQRQLEEDDEIRKFAEAKKKMTRLRKQKDSELFAQRQAFTNRQVEALGKNQQLQLDDEDQRIALAVGEQEAKKDREDREKDEKMMKMYAAMAKHREQQVSLKEKQEREEHKRAEEMLYTRLEADAAYKLKQQEKNQQNYEKKKELQGVHLDQMDKRKENVKAQRHSDIKFDKQNYDLLSLEEQQFQDYAVHVIEEAKGRGCKNVYPLVKAARDGAGGGHGPVFEGKGGIRPSYLVSDPSGIEMPFYQKDTTEEIKNNHKPDLSGNRLGFVW